MYKTLHDSLSRWYDSNGRHDLPWRRTDDPYRIYISEIMLQQTQVKTVLERFYFPFLEAFPTLADLAAASIDDVLKQWEGLGYYTRARNLHAAARRCGKTLPPSAAELMDLPGVGRSTAHAVAAFAYLEPLPILDANVKRILHRFFAVAERNEKRLWECAYALFDSARPFEYNQAMMDLGSAVCLPKRPLCDQCPLQAQCQGRNTPERFPQARTKPAKPVRYRAIVIRTRNRRYALARREGRFLSGLWGFDEYDLPFSEPAEPLGVIVQHYSHFTLDAQVYLCESDPESEGFEWFAMDEITTLSLSRADHKALGLLRYNAGKAQKGTDAEED